MNDIVLLGVICLGLAFYCLYLRAKIGFIMKMGQIILGGIHRGEAHVVERNGVFYPELKEKGE